MTAIGRFSTRPLYLQVKDMLIQRIASGAWKPGAAIPNEIELSRELGISVGTVRKALDEMEGEQLISRRQGRGTFVIDQTSNEQALRFSRIRDTHGVKFAGRTRSSKVLAASASDAEARHLNLRSGDPVYRLSRIREHDDVPFMIEECTVSRSRFPSLDEEADVPPSIVVLAHRYGVLLARAEERIGVASATGDIALNLDVADGTPLLTLDCVVYAIDGRPVEWRTAHCHLGKSHYYSEMH